MKVIFVLAFFAVFENLGWADEESEVWRGESDLSLVDKINLNYFGVFYGPGLKNMSSYQPDVNGNPNPERPVILKNFLEVAYPVLPDVSVSGTFYWIYQPVQNQDIAIQDPFFKIADQSLFQNDSFNLYSDLRVHAAVTSVSRANDSFGGVQTVQALTYGVGTTPLTLGVFGSLRTNFYGKEGFGKDVEVYVAPNLNFALSEKTALLLFYEVLASHVFGNTRNVLTSDGNDVEVGVNWNVSSRLTVNPYLTILTGGQPSLRSTSVGMLLSWVMI